MANEKFLDALLAIDRLSVHEILTDAHQHQDIFEIIEELIVPALEDIGLQWERGTAALSQVYMAGRILEREVDYILPPADPKRTDQPRMAIAVLDDFHMLGKRIIYSLLRASGFELIDFGRVTVEQLYQRILKDDVQVMLISTLMLPSALEVKELTSRLKRAGNTTRIIVGGAPFRLDPSLYKEVGADATAVNIKQTISVIQQNLEVTNAS